jgi:predicted nucleic acid-binding protein
MGIKILDAIAVLAFFHDEPGAQLVEDMILQAQDGKLELAMCVINLGEVYYSIARSRSQQEAESYVQQIQSLPIEIVDVDWELTRLAAQFKTGGNISYADCYAAALAKSCNGDLVTGDKEFKVLKKEIKILWLA